MCSHPPYPTATRSLIRSHRLLNIVVNYTTPCANTFRGTVRTEYAVVIGFSTGQPVRHAGSHSQTYFWRRTLNPVRPMAKAYFAETLLVNSLRYPYIL